MWGTRDGVRRLQGLLDEQHDMLLAGNLTDIDRTVQAFSALVEKISTSDLNADDLARAKRSADRNQRLLGDAIRAVKDVTARLQRSRTAQNGFESYTPYGMARTVGATSAKLIKKI